MKINCILKIINEIKLWLLNHQNLLIQYLKNIILSAIILFFGLIISKKMNQIFKKIISLQKFDKTIKDFLLTIIRYSIIIFTLIASIGNLGIQTTSIITVLGAAGLTIGLALQSSLSNFAAGVLLVTLRPFKIGEKVILGSIKGIVENVHFFSTSICTKDNYIVIIPNNKIINNNIINISRKPYRRIKFIINVAYDSDIDSVKKILFNVIKLDKRVNFNKDISIHLNEMASSTLNFIVYVWTSNKNAKKVYWDLMENFKKQLDFNKIKIPFPQMDVHLHLTKNI